MTDDLIAASHFEFFAKSLSGCGFAAVAAREPEKHEWAAKVVRNDAIDHLAEIVEESINNPKHSTLSLIFPDVTNDDELDRLIPRLNCGVIFLNQCHDTEANRCYRFRAQVGDEQSFISGFGPFDSMPITRQAEITSVVFRTAPRPTYDWHLKEPTAGIIHVADMDMQGMNDRQLRRLWNNSFLTTAGKLGHPPDEESAAKTTFVVPLDRANHISLA